MPGTVLTPLASRARSRSPETPRRSMKAEEVAAGKLFDSGQQLLVPIWQRRYTWDRQDWKELWRDIQHLRAAQASTHFLGSFVLKALPWRGLPSEAKRYWIVDGQQRAITLTLLATAVRDRLARLVENDEERIAVNRAYTDQLLRNASLKEGHQDRLVLQELDASRLTPIINGSAGELSDAPIDRAFAFFVDAVEHFPAEDLEDLLSLVLTRLMAVWVVLEDDDNAHRVFQTLNAGGKPLRQADLVRNYFFLLLGDVGDDFYNAHWRLLEADLTNRELEEYFVAWTISQGHTGAKASLFRYFQLDLSATEEDATAVLEYGKLLTSAAKQFQWIRKPEASPLTVARPALGELHHWGTLPAEGLILLLLRRFADGRLGEEALAECLEFILSFVARRMLAGFEPQLHKDIFVRAAQRLGQRADLTGVEIVEFLRYTLSRGSDVRAWPSTELVVARATSNSLYTVPRAHWVKSILIRADRDTHGVQGNSSVSSPDQVEVHHVMPEDLTQDWVDDLVSWGVEHPAGLHQSRVQVLGNLTLVRPGDVAAEQRFLTKKPCLVGLEVSSDIASVDTWTGNKIDERSGRLAALVCESYETPLDQEALASSRYALTGDELTLSDNAGEQDDEG